MILIRWAGALFSAFQVSVYDNRPYPEGFRNLGLLLAAGLAVGNGVIWIAHRRARSLRHVREVALASVLLDLVVASAFVWLYAFDSESALWAVLFILPLEGAVLYQLAGALLMWGTGTAIYVIREVWGASSYPSAYPDGVQWTSVSFRMGLVLLVGLGVGLMSRSLHRQKRALEEALDQVRRVDRLRARLVSTLAHDVRSPLTVIRGAIKLLLSSRDGMTAATTQELLDSADHQAERLERLARDLLDLARLERGRLELDLTDVALRPAVVSALGFADSKDRYEVRIEPSMMVRADPGRLEQIVVNLAANAIRYGAPPFVAEATHMDGAVTLALRDNGPGVPAAEVEQLFEPFRSETDEGSVGLGLAIVRGLAEAQGGEVTYEPNRPQGACFKLRLLPAERTAPAREGSDAGVTPGS